MEIVEKRPDLKHQQRFEYQFLQDGYLKTGLKTAAC
jgi:hypothetical protein